MSILSGFNAWNVQNALREQHSKKFTDKSKDSVMDCYDSQYRSYKVIDVHKTLCESYGFDDWENTYRDLFLFLETHQKYTYKLFERERTDKMEEIIISDTVYLTYTPKSGIARFKCLNNTVMEIRKYSGSVYWPEQELLPGKSMYHEFECSENPSSPWMVEISNFLNNILPNLRTYQKSLSVVGVYDAHKLRTDIINGHKNSQDRKEDHKNMSDACLNRTVQ